MKTMMKSPNPIKRKKMIEIKWMMAKWTMAKLEQ